MRFMAIQINYRVWSENIINVQTLGLVFVNFCQDIEHILK